MNPKIIRFLVVFIAFASCGFAFAQESNSNKKERLVLTVDDAVNYALKNNQSLKSAAIDLEIKKRANSNSWNTFLPSASLSGTLARSNDIDTIKSSIESNAAFPAFLGYAKNGADLKTSAVAASNIDSSKLIDEMYGSEEAALWHPVGSLSFSWAFNAAMLKSISATKKQYEAGLISWEQSVRETEVNIKKMFYGILLAQENLKIQKESMGNAEARRHQAEINYRNGTVPRLSVLNSQVTYENMKPTILSAENSLKQTKETFGFLLGLPFGTEIDLTGTIETSYVDVNADELFEKYVEQNNEIKSLKKNIELIKTGIDATYLSTFTPSLAVGFGLQPTVSNITKNWFDKDNYSEGGNLTITLAYSNLFDMLPWSSNMQKLKDSKQQLAQAEIGLEQLYQNAEIEVHKLCDNLTVSRANIEAMRNNVTLAQEAYDSTLKAYNNGTQELLAVRDSESSLNQARLGLMNENYNYISAVLDLETKLNITLK